MIASENREPPLSKLTAHSLGKFGGGWLTMVQFVNVRANTPLTDLIRGGFAAFATIDGMPTVPASSRIGLGAKWKNSEGARQVPLPNGMTLAGT
jgi:hypothetical protein